MPHLTNCPHQGEGWCLACVGTLSDERVRLNAELLTAADRIADQSEALSRRAERPTTTAFVAALTVAELNALRLHLIPRELRRRVAGQRAAEWDAHEKDYDAQKANGSGCG